MTLLRMLAAVLLALPRAGLRRALRGPLRPRWSLRLELAAEAQRAVWALLPRLGVVAWREASERFRLGAPGVPRRDVELGGVPAAWFEPPDATGPVILFLHGGGFVLGSTKHTHAGLIGALAKTSRSRVVAIDYRLAPEHVRPAALEDALAAYRALIGAGTDPRSVVVAGDSAGGNLVLVLILALREVGEPLPAAAALICPWVDLGNSGASFETNGRSDFLSREICDLVAGQYLDGQDPLDPAVSPLHADLQGFPPLLVQAGSAEVLVDQIRAFAARARTAGVETRLTVYEDMIHDWHVIPGLPDAHRALDEIAAFARKHAVSER